MTYSRAWCSSAFLALRWLPEPGAGWSAHWTPRWPKVEARQQRAVSTAADIEAALRATLAQSYLPGRTGILLSGGIDSAILARLLPPGTPAFSIRYRAEGAVDETVMAAVYAQECDLDLTVVDVSWEDHERSALGLMAHKRAPLHAVEVGLLCAARSAASMGVDRLIVGNGADSTFGGMDKLLSRDWTVEDFADRYTFVEPHAALEEWESVRGEFEKYRIESLIDTPAFLKRTHGLGIVQSFDNALAAGGSTTVTPYEAMRLATDLDLDRIRAGEPKYLLQELFRFLYPSIETPRKIPFARPMDVWLDDWQGPVHPDFRSDLDIAALTGEQRWLVWALDRFLRMVDFEEIA